jgi:hypothetical protein
MPGPSLLRIPRWCKAMEISTATGYNYINASVIATVTVGGIRHVVESWGDNPPPREGRPPSFEELVWESALGEKPPKRHMPEGVHRGRPRKPVTE